MTPLSELPLLRRSHTPQENAPAGLLLACSSATADLVGVSTVHGNVGAKQVARNVARILTLANRQDVPLFEGADEPLLGQAMDTSSYYGVDGLGDRPDTEPASASITLKPSPGVAAVRLVEAASQYTGQLVLVAIGPLTNIALACKLDPSFALNVKALYVMGGAEVAGNVTPAAEYNFFCDPEAAALVLSKFPLTTLVTWECASRHVIPWAAIDAWSKLQTSKSTFIAAVMEQSVADERAKEPQSAGLIACDPLVVALAAEHGSSDRRILTDSKMVHCSIELAAGALRGQSIFDAEGDGSQAPRVRLVKSIDITMFERELCESMR